MNWGAFIYDNFIGSSSPAEETMDQDLKGIQWSDANKQAIQDMLAQGGFNLPKETANVLPKETPSVLPKGKPYMKFTVIDGPMLASPPVF